MKKNYAFDPELLRRLERRRWEKRLAEKAKKARRRRQSTPRQHRVRDSDPWIDLPVPTSIDLIKARDDACAFFDDVRREVRNGTKVRLSFEATERISAEGLIYLLSQIHKLQLEYGAARITGTYPQNQRVNRLLADSGFFKVLGVRNPRIRGRKQNSARYLSCKSDTSINGPLIPQIREELLGSDLEMPGPVAKKVFRALTEAMANVGHHAYQGKFLRNARVRNRWWLWGQLSRPQNTFTLTFYDAGVGIPKRLPREYPLEWIRGVLSLLPGIMPDDGDMIRAAVKLGRSSTKETNRGKGLMDMHKLIEQVGAGSLTILSRQGQYVFDGGREASYNHPTFIEGTLIKWDLPLDRTVKIIYDGNTTGSEDDEPELQGDDSQDRR